MKYHARMLSVSVALLALAGCGGQQTADAPPPAALTDEAVGYYCGMMLVEHAGPKAQIIVDGRDEPYWFAQVRDGVYFLRSPEEAAQVRAFYVTDYADAAQHDPAHEPQWIAVADAFFVIGSTTKGGMGAPETIPFSTTESAVLYAAEHGGQIVRLDEIPEDYILAPYTPTGENKKDDAHDARQ